MTYEWRDKVVLITGAASGIGEKIVRALLKEDVKHVAVLDVNANAGIQLQNELNSKYGANKVKFFKCDVSNDDQLLGAFKSVKDDQGYIDVVINNAGIMNDSLHIYKKAIEVNVTATVTGSVKALELMRKDDGGRGGTVINVSSVAGLAVTPYLPIYWGTKAAIIQFSNCFGHSEQFAKTGVRCLSVCFGPTATAIGQGLGSYDKRLQEELRNGKATIQKWFVQSPESAASGLIEAYKKGKTGSVWLVNADKPAIDITEKYYSVYENLKDLVSV